MYKIPKSCISELYHVGETIRPVKVITRNPDLLPGFRGQFVLDDAPNSSWQVTKLKLKFHISAYNSTLMRFRAACSTDFSGFLDDVLYGQVDGDVRLLDDWWNGPEDFDEGADWEFINTGEIKDYKGELRPVFKIRNIGFDRWVKLEKLDNFTYLRLAKEDSDTRFMLGAVSDVIYR
ncbi:hypothetical protein [Pseudomonas entomophila]|uniref:hypothetical protein n=1 Tax=Pseudomonas entomophila TaxID=312306 RepID=UPI00200CC1E7|nr:hypothetical protein [Pseudomonas entomophila]